MEYCVGSMHSFLLHTRHYIRNTIHMRVLVFGTFDALHPGHVFVLEKAAARGELHVVVARDATVQRIKSRPPAQPEHERAAAIQAAFPAAHVHLGDPQNYAKPLHTIQPDLVLLGYDQQLPPGVSAKDIPCPVERLPAFEPERYKSSLRRGEWRNKEMEKWKKVF